MSNRGEDEVVWALSEADGKTVRVSRLGPAFRQSMRQSMEGPRCTPTVDGDRHYVIGLAGNMVCSQAADGRIVWQRNLVTDFGGRVPPWRYRESPLIDGNKLICTPEAQDAMLVALDKLTGNTIWKSAVPANPRWGDCRASRSRRRSREFRWVFHRRRRGPADVRSGGCEQRPETLAGRVHGIGRYLVRSPGPGEGRQSHRGAIRRRLL